MEQNHDMDEIDLLELARLLWSHALQIAAAGIAAAVICLLVCTFVLTPRYQASVNLIVNSRQDGNASITSDNINSARNLIDTYAVIIKSNLVLNDVIQRLGLDITYSQLADSITVGSVNSTQIMAITVTNENPGLAGKIAQTIAEVAPDVIVEKVEAGSCKAVSDVDIFVNYHIVLLRVGMQRIRAEQFVVFVVLISGCLVSDCHLFPVIVGVIGIGNIFLSCFCFSGNTAKHIIGVGCRFFRALSILIHNGRNFFCFLSVFEIGTAVLGNHTFSRLVSHRS